MTPKFKKIKCIINVKCLKSSAFDYHLMAKRFHGKHMNFKFCMYIDLHKIIQKLVTLGLHKKKHYFCYMLAIAACEKLQTICLIIKILSNIFKNISFTIFFQVKETFSN